MASSSVQATPDDVLDAVRASLATRPDRVILAVSGGLDSMVMLDAAARVAPDRVAAVATFDHGTGPHARAAVTHVRAEGAARGFEVMVGAGEGVEPSEQGWRRARWTFLVRAAHELSAAVATAHTLDDQVETIAMRILRGAGARGLAGLAADSPIVRPLLDIPRTKIIAYAAAAGVRHVDDPTNLSPRFLRNRLRRDLLPAIGRVRPGFASEILAIGWRAAELRRQVDGVAAAITRAVGPRSVSVSLAALAGIGPDGLAVLAPAVAARAGTVLDRRGTTRLTQFILKGRPGARMQLSGGAEAVRIGDDLVIRRTSAVTASATEQCLDALNVVIGQWRFHRVTQAASDDVWTAALPADRALTVRRWRAGDRMRAGGSPSARRVKRFFSDAGIAGPDRSGWPVVLADGEIVWIPGVRRSDAATDRSGRPVLRYRCERNDL